MQEPPPISEQYIPTLAIETSVTGQADHNIINETPLQKSLESEKDAPKFNARFYGLIAGSLVVIALGFWAGEAILSHLPRIGIKATGVTNFPIATETYLLVPTATPTLSTSTPSTNPIMTGKDGMTLLYVPAGNFTWEVILAIRSKCQFIQFM